MIYLQPEKSLPDEALDPYRIFVFKFQIILASRTNVCYTTISATLLGRRLVFYGGL